jgi:hypothetical protein
VVEATVPLFHEAGAEGGRALLGRPGRQLAAFLAIVAGLIHLLVTPVHFEEAAEYGAFMLLVGAAQIAAGVLLLVRPARSLIVATVLGTLAILMIFAWAYTVGLPFGPEPGEPETLTPVVVVSKVIELGLLGVLLLLLRHPRGRRATRVPEMPRRDRPASKLR